VRIGIFLGCKVYLIEDGFQGILGIYLLLECLYYFLIYPKLKQNNRHSIYN
jgi:hypothetical protein